MKEKIPNVKSKILLIDDLYGNLLVLKEMLHSIGYDNVYILQDPIFAMEKINESFELNNPFKLILTDIKMPNMNGFTLSQKIHKKYPNIPIIAISAAILEAENIKKNKDFASYILKPINIQELQNEIAYYLIN